MSSVDTESLKRLATLANLPAQQLERLAQSLVPRTVKKGAIIFDQ